MERSWGRFTVYGSDQLENRITALLLAVAETLEPMLPPAICRAMVLFGGYGRSEGGVEIDAGTERPHNNLDFLVITEPACREKPDDLKSRVSQAIQPLREQYQIEMDVAVISAAKLTHQPALVMWYDMRFGHKCILGDADFLTELTHFNVDNIPPWDVWRLLVNRGTLLIINDYLLSKCPPQFDPRRTVIRHAVKAIIGYGDALLFFLGAYHWSYREKQRRMREAQRIPDDFRKLYDEAIEFRFRPQYGNYLNRDLRAWMDQLRASFEPIHLKCEAARLNRDALSWRDYAEAALARAFIEDSLSARQWAKKAYNLLRNAAWLNQGSLPARLGYATMGPVGRMSMAFPAVAYYEQAAPCRKMAMSALGARSDDLDELRRRYVMNWSRYGDVNFSKFLKSANLSLEPAAGTPQPQPPPARDNS